MPNEQFINACRDGDTQYIYEHINSANVAYSDITNGLIEVVKKDDFDTMLVLFGHSKVTTMDSFYVVMKYGKNLSMKLMLIDIYIMHGEYDQEVFEFGCKHNIMQIVGGMSFKYCRVDVYAGKQIAIKFNSEDVIRYLK